MLDARSIYEAYFAAVVDEIANRLDRGGGPVGIYSALGAVADEMFDDDVADDAYDLLDACFTPLVVFGYDEQPDDTPVSYVPWTSLELLDLGGDTVFVLLDRTWMDEMLAVIASFARSDNEGLRDYLLDEIAFGAFDGNTLSAAPERISFAAPLTGADIRATLFPLAASSALGEWIDPFLERVTGRKWPTQTEEERERLADAYLDQVLPDSDGPDLPDAILFMSAPQHLGVLLAQIRPEPPEPRADRVDEVSTPDIPIITDEERERINEARMKAMREGRYFVVDPRQEGFEDQLADQLLGPLHHSADSKLTNRDR